LVYYLLSLSVYDSVLHNTDPNLDVAVSNTLPSGTEIPLISTKFRSPLDKPITKNFFFEEINKVTFTAAGSGEASIVFGAGFVPADINKLEVYRGISVKKVIQRIDPVTFSAIGAPISSASIGETVRVSIEVTIPDFSPFLIVTDPFPGAIEPLDSNVYETGSSGRGGGIRPLFYDFYSWWIPPVTTHYLHDKVTFLAGSVYAGSQTFSYLALVNSEGEFVVGPAIAYDKAQPELMGLSAGSVFTTKTIVGASAGLDATCFSLKQRVLDSNSVPGIFGFNNIVTPPPPVNTADTPFLYQSFFLIVVAVMAVFWL